MPQRITIKLGATQRKRLKRLARQTRDARERTRCLIILKYDQGKGSATIARELCCGHSTPHRVARRFLRLGEAAIVDGRADNGTVKADERCLAQLVKLLEGSPRDFQRARPTWTRELLAERIREALGVDLSLSTVGRMLHALGARKGRPKAMVKCPWPAPRRQRRLQRLRALIDHLPRDHVVLWADEVDIELNPKIGWDWMLPGTQKIALTPGRNAKSYLAGALNARTGQVDFVEGERKNSVLFVDLIRLLAHGTYRRAKRIHIIVDNYGIHTSQITRRALAALDGKVVLHFLPPYSPDDNLIERLWKQLHDNVTRNHCCTTMDELMQEVWEFLRAASPFPGSKPSLRKRA
jgi:transposase